MQQQATNYREKVFSAMEELRAGVDEMELLVGKKHWSLPSYGDLLYSVKD